MLRIEMDGHFHGGEPIKPWVAHIGRHCPTYGLEREFVKPMNDWKNASRAWSGNTYGVVATFALREDAMYEVARCRGKPSKRYFAREFFWLESGKMAKRTAEEALEWAERDDPGAAVIHRVTDSADRPWVAEINGLGTPARLGFVVDHAAGERMYRLREGRLYEVREIAGGTERRHIVRAAAGAVHRLTKEEALEWLRKAS